jgi:hypothetical protein
MGLTTLGRSGTLARHAGGVAKNGLEREEIMNEPHLVHNRRKPRRSRLAPITALLALTVLVLVALQSAAASPLRTSAFAKLASSGDNKPLCSSHASLCADVYDKQGNQYVGHDEPSLLFKSGERGSGNDMTYRIRLPKDPQQQPRADGSGSTWNFELRPTFWFGLTLCDTESAPEFTKKCTPDSDRNDLVATDPKRPDYIGKHPGNAFMELQFYGPGYVPQFEGFGCTATQYCAAMTIDSLGLDQNRGVANTAACDNYLLGGEEPINWAYITKSGVSQAPADPLFTGTFDNPNFAAVNPDVTKDLLMSPGDWVTIHIHDTPAGLRIDLVDETTHQSGSMTASLANGFAHVLFTPNASTCTSAPYAFHPEYSTANPRGNTWSAHTYNVAYSDEIGHFEHCNALDANFNCAVAGSDDPTLDDDDVFCVPGTDSLLVQINGCFASDDDFDGPSYQRDWPGTNPNPIVDQRLHPEPLLFTSPTTGRGHDFQKIAFEADFPAIEEDCDRTTGVGCVSPPPGSEFYPFFSTRTLGDNSANFSPDFTAAAAPDSSTNNKGNKGSCIWQEGGDSIPGTVQDFGGSAAAEFGPILQTVFPAAGFTTVLRYDNFNSGDMPNRCTSSNR